MDSNKNFKDFPPESVWSMLGEWYDVPEASTNYANLTDAQNTLRVGQENHYGRVITRLTFSPGIAGVPEKVRAYWRHDGNEMSTYHLAGPVR